MLISIRNPGFTIPSYSPMSSYKSFRQRLLSRLFPVLLLVLVVEAVISVYFIRNYAYDELEHRVNLIGQDTKRNHMLASSLKHQRIFMIEGVGESILSMPEVLYFAIRSPEGELVYEDFKHELANEERIIREFPIILLSSGITDPNDEFFNQQTRTSYGTLIIGFNTRFADERFKAGLLNRGLIALFFLVFISLGVDYVFRTSIGQPLVNLARAMRKARDAEPGVDSHDEIGLLVKEYNQMVDQQNYLLNAAQMMSNSGSWEMDAATGEMAWSDQLFKLFGVEPDAFEPDLAKTVSYVHPDDRQLVQRAIDKTIQQCKDFNQEIRIIRADGQERIVYFQTHCFAGEWRKIVRVIGNLTDITERKKKDTEHLQSMKLHALGSLASGMAHSLNNLILPILISSRMALKNIHQDSDDRERLNRVVMAAERASQLIAKVLEFSHQEESSFTDVNVTDVVRNALRLIQVTAPSAIKIESNLLNQKAMIRGDMAQLEAIILDLASNAIGSMEGMNGKLCISLQLENVEQEIPGLPASVQPGRYAMIKVEDTGIGMDESMIKKVFDPFFTTKTNGKGTGLGLSNVDGTVSTHQGYIQVDSIPGKGSCFRLYFPLVEKQ